MSRPEYVSKLTPEKKKALEEIKAKNAAVIKENSQIKNLNADLIKARQDNKDKNYTEAESLMTRDTQAKPDAAVLWVELGVAQKGLKKYDDADHFAQEGRRARGGQQEAQCRHSGRRERCSG